MIVQAIVIVAIVIFCVVMIFVVRGDDEQSIGNRRRR
jgi:hypothetical protein